VKETAWLPRASIPTTIDIRFSITATSDTVLAAPVEIQQILMNLAANASLAAESAREVGIREFFIKPVTKQELAETIRRVLDTKTNG
jgi:hypothetical protein